MFSFELIRKLSLDRYHASSQTLYLSRERYYASSQTLYLSRERYYASSQTEYLSRERYYASLQPQYLSWVVQESNSEKGRPVLILIILKQCESERDNKLGYKVT